MTAIAELARANAIQVEAKKHALRQQQDGCWIMTLRVHPNDMPEQIMKAAMGTRYMMALVEIGDDEQPLPPHPAVAAPRPVEASQPSPAGENKCVAVAYGGKQCVGRCMEPKDCSGKPIADKADKRKFSEMAPAQQAGIICNEQAFHKFLIEKFYRVWMRCDDLTDTRRAANCVREICKVDSRSDIKPDNADWSALVLAYRLWQREPEFVA